MPHTDEMGRQIEGFMACLPDLLRNYEGQYVAFEDGKVLAYGPSVRHVLNAVNELRGDVRPILVRCVQASYPPIEL